MTIVMRHFFIYLFIYLESAKARSKAVSFRESLTPPLFKMDNPTFSLQLLLTWPTLQLCLFCYSLLQLPVCKSPSPKF